MTDVPNLLLRNAITAVIVQTGHQPNPYLFEKWEYEPGNGVSTTVIRVHDNETHYMGSERSRISCSPFFDRRTFDPFCDLVTVGMIKAGYEITSINQVWLGDVLKGSWGILFRVKEDQPK